MSNVIVKKPYCKVCCDAGKPKNEYTSHWVKDLAGKTTCPTLLNTECRYCYKLGHTAKFCQVLAKNNKEKERAERRQNGAIISSLAVTQKQTVKKKQLIGFAALYEDSESEEENEEKVSNVIEEFPSLCEPAKQVEVSVTGWAAIVAKPVIKSVIVNVPKVVIEKVPETKPKPIQMKSWADWSDSEDEDENEEDSYPQTYSYEDEDKTWLE